MTEVTNVSNLFNYQSIGKANNQQKAPENKVENLQQALEDGKLTKKEYEALKTKFVSESLGTNTEGKTQETEGKLNSLFEEKMKSAIGTNTFEALKNSSETEPVSINFMDLGDGVVRTSNSKSGAEEVFAKNMENVQVNVENNGGKFNYASEESTHFNNGLKEVANEETEKKSGLITGGLINAEKSLYDGGSLNDLIENMELTEKPETKPRKGGSENVQKLQSFLGVPKEHQDGLFGAETMTHLKKKLSEAIKTGDGPTVEKLKAIVTSLDSRLNNQKTNDPKLKQLTEATEKFTVTNNKKEQLAQSKEFLDQAVQAIKSDDQDKFSEIIQNVKQSTLPESLREKIMMNFSEMASERLAYNIGNQAARGNPPEKQLEGSGLIDNVDPEYSSPRAKASKQAFESMYDSSEGAEGLKTWSLKADPQNAIDFTNSDKFRSTTPKMKEVVSGYLGDFMYRELSKNPRKPEVAAAYLAKLTPDVAVEVLKKINVLHDNPRASSLIEQALPKDYQNTLRAYLASTAK